MSLIVNSLRSTSHMRRVDQHRDEIWSFVYAKQKNVPECMDGKAGDVWTWTCLDSDTKKLMISWFVGTRDAKAAYEFLCDVVTRMQLTSDGHSAYVPAVDAVFGQYIDYAQRVKIYGAPEGRWKTTATPSPCTSCTITGAGSTRAYASARPWKRGSN